MYAAPKDEKTKSNKPNTSSSMSSSSSNQVNDGEDDMVKAFRQKLIKKQGGCDTTDEQHEDMDNYEEHDTEQDMLDREQKRKLKTNPNFGASARYSNLERIAGKKRRYGLTQDEQAERFAFLKNAPTEGTFAKNIEIRHKPFNEVIRNVQCIRCGEWGHASGDRECSLRDCNPHDFARLKREDPLTYMQSDEFLIEKQKMILRHAAASSSNNNNQLQQYPSHLSTSKSNQPTGKLSKTTGFEMQLQDDDDDIISSDPEKEYIDTLTSREKRLLLKRLKKLENPEIHTDNNDSNSSSDDSSSSSSDSDDDSDLSSISNKSFNIATSNPSQGKTSSSSSNKKTVSSSDHSHINNHNDHKSHKDKLNATATDTTIDDEEDTKKKKKKSDKKHKKHKKHKSHKSKS